MRHHKLFAPLVFIACLLATCGSVKAGPCYLAFDDGPTSNTVTLVNKLKAVSARATFFIWGSRISSNLTGFNAIRSANFSIQNHSYTHSHMLTWSYTQVYNDIKKCQDAIKNAGGGTPKYYRPPYLEVNDTIRSACAALGLTIVMPTVDSKDWNGATTSQIIANCNALATGGNTLMHDGYTTTDNAISSIVTNLRSRGLYTSQY